VTVDALSVGVTHSWRAAAASARPYHQVATEWFDQSTTRASPPRPKKAIRRTEAVKVACNEGDYSKVNLNDKAKLQRVEVEIAVSIPLPPVPSRRSLRARARRGRNG